MPRSVLDESGRRRHNFGFPRLAARTNRDDIVSGKTGRCLPDEWSAARGEWLEHSRAGDLGGLVHGTGNTNGSGHDSIRRYFTIRKSDGFLSEIRWPHSGLLFQKAVRGSVPLHIFG